MASLKRAAHESREQTANLPLHIGFILVKKVFGNFVQYLSNFQHFVTFESNGQYFLRFSFVGIESVNLQINAQKINYNLMKKIFFVHMLMPFYRKTGKFNFVLILNPNFLKKFKLIKVDSNVQVKEQLCNKNYLFSDTLHSCKEKAQ